MLLGKVGWIFGSDGHFKWLIQCRYLQYLWSQAVKTSVNSVLVSPPICSPVPSPIPNSCVSIRQIRGETGVRFKLGANWLFWNLDTGGYHSLFWFLDWWLFTQHRNAGWSLESVHFWVSPKIFFPLYRASHHVLCVAQTPGSYALKMKELHQKVLKLLEAGS